MIKLAVFFAVPFIVSFIFTGLFFRYLYTQENRRRNSEIDRGYIRKFGQVPRPPGYKKP